MRSRPRSYTTITICLQFHNDRFKAASHCLQPDEVREAELDWNAIELGLMPDPTGASDAPRLRSLLLPLRLLFALRIISRLLPHHAYSVSLLCSAYSSSPSMASAVASSRVGEQKELSKYACTTCARRKVCDHLYTKLCCIPSYAVCL